jgi:hypothetical protein
MGTTLEPNVVTIRVACPQHLCVMTRLFCPAVSHILFEEAVEHLEGLVEKLIS